LIIKNYEKLKRKLYSTGLDLIRRKFLEKQTNYKNDLVYFFIASVLVSFFADAFFASVRDVSIFEVIPGLDLVDKVLTQSPTYHQTLKFNTVLPIYGYLPSPPTGALVIFILRQIHYKKKSRGKADEYPGSRILFLFLVFIPLLLLINTISIVFESTNYKTFFDKYIKLLTPIINFSLSLLNIFFYIGIFSTWLFDWFLFSRVWQ